MNERAYAAMREKTANGVYDVLVAHCGAREASREDFVYTHTREFCIEYRFMGSLGFGGKFWRNHSFRPDGTYGEHWYVSNYREDETPVTRAAAEAAAGPLDDLRARHEADPGHPENLER